MLSEEHGTSTHSPPVQDNNSTSEAAATSHHNQVSYLGQVSRGITDYIKDASQDIAESVILIRDLHLGTAEPDDLTRHRTAPRNPLGGQVSGFLFRIVGVDEECDGLPDAKAVTDADGNIHTSTTEAKDGAEYPNTYAANSEFRNGAEMVMSAPPIVRERRLSYFEDSDLSSPCSSSSTFAETSFADSSRTPVSHSSSTVSNASSVGSESKQTIRRQRSATIANPLGFEPNSPIRSLDHRRRSLDVGLLREMKGFEVYSTCPKKIKLSIAAETSLNHIRARSEASTMSRGSVIDEPIAEEPAIEPISQKSPTACKQKSHDGSTSTDAHHNYAHDHPHDFHIVNLATPSDCQFCNRFIWGLRKQGAVCRNCKYLCHDRCRKLVAHDCGVTHLKATGAGTARLSTDGGRSTQDDGNRHVVRKPKVISQKNHFFEMTMFLGPTSCGSCGKSISYMARLSWKCKLCGVPSHGKCIQKIEISCPNGLKAGNKSKKAENQNGFSMGAALKGGVLPMALHPISSLLSPHKIKARRNSSASLLNVGVQKYMRVIPNGADECARLAITEPPRITIPPKKPDAPAIVDKTNRVCARTTNFLDRSPQLPTSEPMPLCVFRGHALYSFATAGTTLSSSKPENRCDVCLLTQDKAAEYGALLSCKQCALQCHVGCTHSIPNHCNMSDVTPTATPTSPSQPCTPVYPFFGPQNGTSNLPGISSQDAMDVDMSPRSPLSSPSSPTRRLTPPSALSRSSSIVSGPPIVQYGAAPAKDLIVLEDLVIEEHVLGSGQFGVVKRGYYQATKERVAIKCVEKKKVFPMYSVRRAAAPRTGGPDTVGVALERELTILKKCSHPGIIRLHHTIESPNMLYLIMDLVEGGDLLEYIMTRDCIVEDEAKFLFHQICVAVRYLHKRGIVHRDLKPENLLLSDEDVVKRVRIADFGFATLLGGQRQLLHSVIGTPSYMAPEIVDTRLNVNGYDQAADLWSLGVILYVMLGGVFPFETDRPIIDQIKAGEFFFPDAQFANVSDCAIDLCCNLLVVDPRRRFTVDQALAHPWLQVRSQLNFAT